ncbi:TPA: CotH kinase family protein [Klebsiella pneumoniae]|uniref:CotH kinase family protein n=1 Tax=Klebsiella TaxID=570 RepID=UPI001CE0FFC3|nr:CotH kinase family protein [Klebsiella pneumoniae]MCA5122327.1 CotH kinase family protein [Klebsiella pneumoniae]MCA5129245.1 CotH kinase family protein [Klebsiella pneumoniae]MCA5210693.1 CotH kinase family protein [Klebsiella pneumoniae]MCA5232540.1 CotH kinase family protein [Klebsiella pneumoniae]MDD1070863.1 CotH kinase family protein [Klebsiella pneumoniae]
MAELNPPLGTTTPEIFLDNVKRADKLVNGPAATVPDRGGEPLDSWRLIMEKVADVLAAYQENGGVLAFASEQALLAFTPDKPNVLALDSTTGAYWFWDGTKWIKNSYQFAEIAGEQSLAIQRLFVTLQLLSGAMNDLDTTDQIISETLQRLVVSQQVIAEGVNELSQLPDTAEDIRLHTLYAISVLGGQMVPLDGFTPGSDDLQTSQLSTLMALSVLGNALLPLEGFNPASSGGGSGDAGSPLRYPGIYAFGEPRGLVRIDLTSPSGAPTSKDDAIKGSVRFDIDGEVFSAYCLLSVQGATSAAYPKKNMSIELYPDATYAKTVSLKIGDVLPHEEWVFKANWIDSTHVRNTLCYNLWDKVVETRRSWPKREIDNTYIGKTGAAAVDTGATGHPKGYACITYLNGDFYGIGDLMIGKKRKNYNIAKNEATQILIGFDGAVNIPALPDDGTWELKAPSKSHDETTAALNAWRAFASSSQADFAANASAHLDATNIIDFYVFMCVICAPDCVQKNTQFLTWDGVKWYFMPYDLDTVFGLRWDGKEISYAPTLNLFDNGLVMGANRTFWNKVRTTWLTEMNARYAELRTAGVFSVDTVYTLAHDLMSRYSEEMFAAEYAKWPTVPSLNVTSLDQILTWLDARLNYLDTFFSYNP